MALIYIHIPFCKKKCFYCDFYSTSNLKLIDEYINVLLQEIELKKNFLNFNKLKYSTIYFGGGTPSLLSKEQLKKILDSIFTNFNFTKEIEQTIELNPDDINEEYLISLKKIEFNRLSIGVQSLNNNTLKYLNRRHNSEQAINSIVLASKIGFENISADYIFGLENQTIKQVEQELNCLLKLPIKHLSAYHLELNNNSIFNKLLNKEKIKELDENISYLQYKKLIETTQIYKFNHYEVSNFAKKNFESQHNSSYWKLKPYLGLGASSHSYIKNNRMWNFSDIAKYIYQIKNKNYYAEKEILSKKDSFNEYIMLALRTKKGISKIKLNKFAKDYAFDFYKNLNKLNSKYFIENRNNIYLSEDAIFVSDNIISCLFV